MEFTGKVSGLSQDYQTGIFTISFMVNEKDAVISGYDSIKNIEKLDIKAVTHREKRSLNANAYYWELVGKLSKVTGDSNRRIHNIMLDRYGELDKMPDGSLIPFCIRDDIDYTEFPYPHLKPTQKTLSKGDKLYRWYYQIKGSSEYNTVEMSRLIDGIVGECKEAGIETLPPDQLERMMTVYAKKHTDG